MCLYCHSKKRAAGDYVSIQLVQSALPANKASHANSMTAAHHKVVN